jgi:tRNA (Thr-GGU) A37 N-methylase
MYKLEEEPSLLVVYYLHKANSVKSVFNRRLDGKRVGVFAARTPYRLSKIAVSEVKLLRIEGHTLYVDGLDAIDGSPVLDIKLGLRHSERSNR